MSRAQAKPPFSVVRPAWVVSLLAMANWALAASGGPDNYGYTWRDGAEPGITYAWEDISASGTDITMSVRGDDRNTGLRALQFSFPYRGLTYTRLAACTNGWVSVVDGGSVDWDNVALPTAGSSAGTIAALWDDFTIRNQGRMYRQDFADHVVVQWEGVPYVDDEALEATFQVILHADGRIVAQIASTTGPLDSATIGIESVDETDGLTVWFNGPIPAPPYVVQFDPPAPIVPLLDCPSAVALTCGSVIDGDLAAGIANQSEYRCRRPDLTGREQVYVVDFATPTTARFILETISGSPQMLLVPACDPNVCSVPAGGLLSLSGATGRFYLIVDCVAGEEGQYTLRGECLPLATTLDCIGPQTADCGVTVTGDLGVGASNQDSYWCSLSDYSGSEQVWLVDFPIQISSATFTLTTLSGNPDLIVIYPCDANACLAPPSDIVTIADPVGPYYVVVDCAPGDEGAYELNVSGGTAPTRIVGNSLRATGHGIDTVDFDWSLAGVPHPAEHYVVLRSDDDPQGPFVMQAAQRGTTWTDPAATARFTPVHVWYYAVLLSDSCGNLSSD